MNRSILLIVLLGLCCLPINHLLPQTNNQEQYRLHIKRASSSIVVDGRLDEAAWQEAEVATDFWQKWPKVQPHGKPRTEVRATYDDHFLYFGFVCYDTSYYVIQTLKRDVDVWSSDGVGVLLDPVNERTNGYYFHVSPYGVQSEGTVSMEASNDDPVSWTWDNKWFAEVQRYDDHWVVEMAIPFKTLRYNNVVSGWGLQFARNVPKGSQYHTWTPIPQQYMGTDLGYTGLLVWDEPPAPAKGNVALIPYVSGAYNQDYTTDPQTREGTPAVGLDAKVAVTSSLNLDLTVNPDFSQVEVDEQVTNLERFSIFFPEKRTFFLENSDIFSGFGIPPLRPFFSRRIGLDEEGNPVPIRFGARLTGNLTDKWRIGILNMHTGSTGEQAPQNYTAAAFQRRLWKRSNISGIVLNRQAFNGSRPDYDDFGRNAGFEFNYLNESGSRQLWAGYNHSFKPHIALNDASGFTNVGVLLRGSTLRLIQSLVKVGENYYTDMGFNRRIVQYDAARDTAIRVGFAHSYTDLSANFYPDKGPFNMIEGGLQNFVLWNLPDYSFGEHNSELRFLGIFRNMSNIFAFVSRNTVDVLFPFEFSFTEQPLPATRYQTTNFSIGYGSDARKAFSWEANINYGGFYNGTLTVLGGSIKWRHQPRLNLELGAEFNDVNLPDEYGDAKLLLIKSRVEVNFSRNLWWTTFLQFNVQGENFNINSRLQWRFAPMSDLFLVYTHNYIVDEDDSIDAFRITGISSENRALVLKATYWLTP